MEKQQQAAMQAMEEWLADEHELGRAPARIECAGTFERYDMRYYIFKYKKSPLGKWLLGVCGGYKGDSLAHCGHVFSEMEPYEAQTATEDAVKLVETVRDFYRRMAGRAREADAREAGTDHSESFIAFVLLDAARFDPERFRRDLRDGWGVECPDDAGRGDGGNTLVFDAEGAMVAISLMPAPVPDGEAEQNAANNYMWPEAVETVRGHQAHLVVAVLGKGAKPVDSGKLLVKACAACLGQEGTLGVYTAGTVLQPEFYLRVARAMREGELPVLDWVYFGLYRDRQGKMCGYTYGLASFGKEELEVLGSDAGPDELHSFLFDIVYYLLDGDVTLRDGETVGFSEGQKLPVTRSKGEAVEGYSLKIAL